MTIEDIYDNIIYNKILEIDNCLNKYSMLYTLEEVRYHSKRYINIIYGGKNDTYLNYFKGVYTLKDSFIETLYHNIKTDGIEFLKKYKIKDIYLIIEEFDNYIRKIKLEKNNIDRIYTYEQFLNFIEKFKEESISTSEYDFNSFFFKFNRSMKINKLLNEKRTKIQTR